MKFHDFSASIFALIFGRIFLPKIGIPFGTLLGPFGPFGLHLAPFAPPSAPFGPLLASFWHPLAPFGLHFGPFWRQLCSKVKFFGTRIQDIAIINAICIYKFQNYYGSGGKHRHLFTKNVIWSTFFQDRWNWPEIKVLISVARDCATTIFHCRKLQRLITVYSRYLPEQTRW